MRVVFGVAVALVVLCVGVVAATYFGVFSLSETSDAATPNTAAPKTAPATTAPKPAPAPAPSTPQAAAPKITNQKTYGDWQYSCLNFADGKVQCSIVQTLSDTKTKQPVFQWRIGQKSNGGLLGIWQTPTGVMVNRGNCQSFVLQSPDHQGHQGQLEFGQREWLDAACEPIEVTVC